MIHFYSEHKNKRNSFELIEDSKTSSIIELLCLFPDEIIWKILKNACSIRDPELFDIGKLIRTEFWPRWDSRNTSNFRFVEPDVALYFEKKCIIIEAKIGDNNPQNEAQWQKEVTAYRNEKCNSNAIIIAIDGNHDNFECLEIKDLYYINEKFWVYRTNWVLLKKAIEESDSSPRLVKLITKAFNLFGHGDYKTFEDLFNQWDGIDLSKLNVLRYNNYYNYKIMDNSKFNTIHSVQIARDLFYGYNRSIESIISWIKSFFKSPNNGNEGNTLKILTDNIRYSIFTEGYNKHLSVLRIDKSDDETVKEPYLVLLFYYNPQSDKYKNWEGWEYDDNKICLKDKCKIIRYESENNKPKSDLNVPVFGYFAIPACEISNEKECKNIVGKAFDWFNEELRKINVEEIAIKKRLFWPDNMQD